MQQKILGGVIPTNKVVTALLESFSKNIFHDNT